MKEFIKKLFSKDDSVSSKRFIGLFSFATLLAVIFSFLIWTKPLPEYMFTGLLTLITVSILTTTVEKFNKPQP